MASIEIAFLGPQGTYSHLVATKYFGKKQNMYPLSTITDVCNFVSEKSDRCGIVPIENSSGGAIYETVDILLNSKSGINILEEVALNVQLALLGVKGEDIKYIYSHFAPLEHCTPWINRNFPHAEKRKVGSTAIAAEHAAKERNAAALGSRALARIHNLDILEFPVQSDIINMTMFLVIGGKKYKQPSPRKTLLSVHLPNVPGSLCTFLEAFRKENVNLSKIISRPIPGHPREYAFLVETTGNPTSSAFKRAISDAREVAMLLRVIGSFPCSKSYKS